MRFRITFNRTYEELKFGKATFIDVKNCWRYAA